MSNQIIKVILVFLFVAQSRAFECSSNWIEYYNHCYSRLFIEASYKDSLDLCAYHGSELLTINSEEEQEFVTRYLLDNDISIWFDSANSDYKKWANKSDESFK